jgi:hypothetical protein
MPTKLNETLLIIGAGAHVPYGMPTGSNLNDQILQLFSSVQLPQEKEDIDEDKLNRLLQMNIGSENEDPTTLLSFLVKEALAREGIVLSVNDVRNYMSDFLDKFNSSGATSIDYFMQMRSEGIRLNLKGLGEKEVKKSLAIHEKIGKVLICFFILRSQHNSRLIGGRDSHMADWFSDIVNKFAIDRRDFLKFWSEKFPKVITFNYDILLERHILNSLTSFDYATNEKAVEIINNMDILHVYGKVGEFDWRDDYSITIEKFFSYVDNVKVIERNQNPQEFIKKASALYTSTKSILFFGFGFDEANLELLALSFKGKINEPFGAGRQISSSRYNLPTFNHRLFLKYCSNGTYVSDSTDSMGMIIRYDTEENILNNELGRNLSIVEMLDKGFVQSVY